MQCVLFAASSGDIEDGTFHTTHPSFQQLLYLNVKKWSEKHCFNQSQPGGVLYMKQDRENHSTADRSMHVDTRSYYNDTHMCPERDYKIKCKIKSRPHR